MAGGKREPSTYMGPEVVEEGDEEEEPEEIASHELGKGHDQFLLEEYGTHLTFSLGWSSGEAEPVDLDLASVAINSAGNVVDAAFYADLKGNTSYLRHLGDSRRGGSSHKESHEKVCLIIDEIPRSVAAILLFVTRFPKPPPELFPGPGGGGRGSSGASAELRVLSESLEELAFMPLPTPLLSAASPVRACLPCALHRVRNGWSLRGLHVSASAASWPLAMRELEHELAAVVPAMQRPLQILGPTDWPEKLEDLTLAEMALRQRAGVGGAAPPPRAPAAPPEAPLLSLQLDVSWEGPEGSGAELADVACVIFDETGGRVDTVSRTNRGADGLSLTTSAATLGEEQERWPGMLPVCERLQLDFEDLDPSVSSLVVLVSCFGAGDLEALRTCHLRITDISSEDEPVDIASLAVDVPNQAPPRDTGGNEEGEEEEDEDGGAPREDPPRAIIVCQLWRPAANKALAAWKAEGSPAAAPFFSALQRRQRLPPQSGGLAPLLSLEALPREREGSPSDWRMRPEALLCVGGDLEDCVERMVDCATYSGARNAKQLRHDELCSSMYANGDSYIGNYSDGQRSGLGLYFFNAGGLYLGSYRRGRRWGSGYLLLPDGSFYDGQFRNDRIEGKGHYGYANGDEHVGEFLRGQKHGLGVYKYKDGGQISGTWSHGAQQGPAHWQLGTYGAFDGTFNAGLPCGRASFVLAPQGIALAQHGVYATPPPPPIDEDNEEEVVPVPSVANQWQGLQWAPARGGLGLAPGERLRPGSAALGRVGVGAPVMRMRPASAAPFMRPASAAPVASGGSLRPSTAQLANGKGSGKGIARPCSAPTQPSKFTLGGRASVLRRGGKNFHL